MDVKHSTMGAVGGRAGWEGTRTSARTHGDVNPPLSPVQMLTSWVIIIWSLYEFTQCSLCNSHMLQSRATCCFLKPPSLPPPDDNSPSNSHWAASLLQSRTAVGQQGCWLLISLPRFLGGCTRKSQDSRVSNTHAHQPH